MALGHWGRFGVGTALVGAVAALLACGGDHAGGVTGPPAGMASCAGNALLTRAPVALTALQDIVPLGLLNPPNHVFPSDHLYLNQMAGASYTPLVAPGAITVTQVGKESMTTDGTTTVEYIVKFFPCADVMFYFYHIAALAPALQAQVGALTGNCNATYVVGRSTYQQCYKDVSIALAAGTAIGTMPATGMADLGACDRRVPALPYVNPGRTLGGSGDFGANHTVCPLDYFTTDVGTALRALLGAGGIKRTVAPVCGDVMQDRAGTAQGRWYYDATDPEDHHLALVHGYADATVVAFSVGSSIATLPLGIYTFAPRATGRVNADFSRVTADGTVYCYEVSLPSSLRIFVRMSDASTLQIGASPGVGCGDPATWNAANAATQFRR